MDIFNCVQLPECTSSIENVARRLLLGPPALSFLSKIIKACFVFVQSILNHPWPAVSVAAKSSQGSKCLGHT